MHCFYYNNVHFSGTITSFDEVLFTHDDRKLQLITVAVIYIANVLIAFSNLSQ